jgi:Na+/H+ antiporter NhaD/arsenite permease-like protein
MLLLFGAVIANIFGTTGASMLLIRPFLRMNKGHIRPFHVVFFIFIISNAGGLLTPIGDPPLFLGYLNGVPFWWITEHCLWMWVFVVAALVLIFFVIDSIDHDKTPRPAPEDAGSPRFIHGIQNLLILGVIIWAVFRPSFTVGLGLLRERGVSAALLGQTLLCREIVMLAAAAASMLLTGRQIHQRNAFNYGPIREVAILFIGIFATMAPALQWLNVNAHRMPLNTPGQFYFASGSLSSVLDNAPTYLTFLETELGKLDRAKVEAAGAELKKMAANKSLEIDLALDEEVRAALEALVKYHPKEVMEQAITPEQLEVAFLLGQERLNVFIVAISMGSVLFGACTYIGNGPNFMVKSIAEAAAVRMPGFIGYILRYTLPILLPLYIAVWVLFLRRS